MNQDNVSQNSEEIPEVRPPKSEKYSSNSSKKEEPNQNNNEETEKLEINSKKESKSQKNEEPMEIDYQEDFFDDFFGSQQHLQFSYNPNQIYDLEQARARTYQPENPKKNENNKPGQTKENNDNESKTENAKNDNSEKIKGDNKKNEEELKENNLKEDVKVTITKSSPILKKKKSRKNMNHRNIKKIEETNTEKNQNKIQSQNMDFIRKMKEKSGKKMKDVNYERQKKVRKRIRLTKGSFFRKRLPKNLAGLKGAKLREISGIKGLLYVNTSRNLAGAKTLTSILTLAESSL